MSESPEILDFVKAMADADRLRIIGVLARHQANQVEIANDLHLPLRDVVDHLTFLAHVGVVGLQGNMYALNPEKLEKLARSHFGEGKLAYVPTPELDEKSRRVLVTFLNADGTIKQLPVQQPAKLQVILSYLVEAFTPGVDYTEKEVNTIIRRFHVDVSGLRRDLVDAGMLARERDGSRYWRVDQLEQNAAQDGKGGTK